MMSENTEYVYVESSMTFGDWTYYNPKYIPEEDHWRVRATHEPSGRKYFVVIDKCDTNILYDAREKIKRFHKKRWIMKFFLALIDVLQKCRENDEKIQESDDI